MGSESDMVDAWVIATFVLCRASFWEEGRSLVTKNFPPFGERDSGTWICQKHTPTHTCVCVCTYIFYVKTFSGPCMMIKACS